MSQTLPTSNSIQPMSGGRALAEMLQVAGVGPIFGMGGFQLLPFYEACRVLGLRHTLIDDERSGAFAADSYAKVTNRPGCVDATLGPGVTNLVTGLVESLNAGTPIIAIAGDRQPPARDEEHDAGDASARNSSAGREGGNPR